MTSSTSTPRVRTRWRHSSAATRGVSRVVTRRMDYRLRGGWYTRRLYNHEVQAVVAISEGVRAALIASGVDAARIHARAERRRRRALRAEPRRARAAARARYGVADDACLLVVVGALEDAQGPRRAARRAGARSRDPRARGLCAPARARRGRRSRRERDALGLGDAVRFLGRVDDVATLLAAADVMVMPSRQEGLGVAALEAMAAGLPGDREPRRRPAGGGRRRRDRAARARPATRAALAAAIARARGRSARSRAGSAPPARPASARASRMAAHGGRDARRLSPARAAAWRRTMGETAKLRRLVRRFRRHARAGDRRPHARPVRLGRRRVASRPRRRCRSCGCAGRKGAPAAPATSSATSSRSADAPTPAGSSATTSPAARSARALAAAGGGLAGVVRSRALGDHRQDPRHRPQPAGRALRPGSRRRRRPGASRATGCAPGSRRMRAATR